jgi:hypothetical protein
MARKSNRDPVELASEIGSRAFDLYQHGDVTACRALATIARVNPEVLAWLRDRLLEITQRDVAELADPSPSPVREPDGWWTCGARRQNSASTGPRADCGYPFCGCSPEASRAMQALQECGWLSPDDVQERVGELMAEIARLRSGAHQ